MKFEDVLEAADQLPVDEQELLLQVVKRRLVQMRRDGLVADVLAGLDEFKQGQCVVATPKELMSEIQA